MTKPRFARVCAGIPVRLAATATLTALLGVADSVSAAPLYFDFATDPNIAGNWVNSAFYGSVGTAT